MELLTAMALTDEEKEAAKFLDRDFTQCFQQMRHYDGQNVDIVKFALTAYSAISGAALAFYKYGLDRSVSYRAPALAVLIVGLLLGVTLFTLMLRNRTYFVIVTRYVNEHRQFFLKDKPLGFANTTRMYANSAQPPYFNWRSSQELLLYSLAVLNAGLFGLALYVVFDSSKYHWCIVGTGTPLLVAVQLGLGIAYLRSREGKSASEAVFGHD